MSSSHHQGWHTRRQRQKTRQKQREIWQQDATEARKKARRGLDLAAGLKAYRKFLGLTQARFGCEFGYSEKSIRDYEAGIRDVPGALISKILLRGDTELHSLFNVKPDPVPRHIKSAIFQRFLEATKYFQKKNLYDLFDAQEDIIEIGFELQHFGAIQDSVVRDRVEQAWQGIEAMYENGWPGYANLEWEEEALAKQIESERRRTLRQRRKNKKRTSQKF
ncbi:hypothetical protein CEW89_08645 [Celeribacter ethanolicus]|uniref:Uncharacterized protein n=1 Tax=Celeribacter ethanolicus TaxID=1758178 RepID=A0A291GCB0_9RHOB|nr:helix-turn-helix transcriptional regulator [Celeribacter ethanolicus]ATG47636.1 hypothetical protein CEW89_08645 [Celeribacter ethanolicus]